LIPPRATRQAISPRAATDHVVAAVAGDTVCAITADQYIPLVVEL
jgi:hypothetical protein